MQQPTGRPDYNWQEFATKESFEKMKGERAEQTEAWRKRLQRFGHTGRGALPMALEGAGAAGIVMSNWSNGFGVNKIFGASTKRVPTIDLSLEDYGLLYRLTESGKAPKISVRIDSKELGVVPTFNTIAEIRGSEKPDEYVILSAHFASFVAAGAPAFSLSSLNWSYGTYTWHTNRDTYDKIVWDDVQSNIILTAILAYMASEDPQTTLRDRSLLPINPRTGERSTWPRQSRATRLGGMN